MYSDGKPLLGDAEKGKNGKCKGSKKSDPEGIHNNRKRGTFRVSGKGTVRDDALLELETTHFWNIAWPIVKDAADKSKSSGDFNPILPSLYILPVTILSRWL